MASTSSRKRKNPVANSGKRNKRKMKEEEDFSGSDEYEKMDPLMDEPQDKLPEQLLETFIKPSGVLLIAGMVSWDFVGKRDGARNQMYPNLYTFHKFTNIKFRFIASSCSSAHSLLVAEDGTAFAFGCNTFGQLGFGDTITRNVPEAIPKLKDYSIIHAATGKCHSLFVTDKGVVYACGDNKFGQCGTGNISAQLVVEPTRVYYNGPPIVRVGCGSRFSMILDITGALHSFGLPEYGQLGHKTDGKYFINSSKLSYQFHIIPKKIEFFVNKVKSQVLFINNVQIVDFSCGNNHTVAIDSKKRAFSWGFGGFGRLGHSEQRDEDVPRLVKFFDCQNRGVRSVHCGSAYSLAVNDLGALYSFGQTKRTGEANMYPKPVHDLIGWNIHSIGTGNTSIVVSADDTLVVWGASPTYGELGIGDINKSSAQPKEVTRMNGINTTQVTMGYSHTLLICDDSSEEAKDKLSNFPRFEP